MNGGIEVVRDGSRGLQLVRFRGSPIRANISEKNGVV